MIDTQLEFEEIAKKLEAGNEQERLQAMENLSRLAPDPRAITLLINFIETDTSELRLDAITALSFFDSPKAIQTLLGLIKPTEPRQVIWNSGQALSEIGDEKVPFLLEALKEPIELTQHWAIDLIREAIRDGYTGNIPTQPLINIVSSSSSLNLKQFAMDLLVSLGDKQAVEPLIKSLYDPDPDVQIFAAVFLKFLGASSAILPLSQLVNDKSIEGRVRAVFLHVMARLNPEQIFEVLVKFLDDPDIEVKGSAVEELGESKNLKATQPLLKLLNDSNEAEEIRKEAIEALGKLGDKLAFESLLKAWKDESEISVQLTAVEALGNLGDKRAVEPLIEALKEKNSFVPEFAVIALDKLGDKRAVEPLIEVLLDQSRVTPKQAAAVALGKLASPEVIEALVKTLKAENWQLRKTVIKALDESGTDKSLLVAPLLEAFYASKTTEIWLPERRGLNQECLVTNGATYRLSMAK